MKLNFAQDIFDLTPRAELNAFFLPEVHSMGKDSISFRMSDLRKTGKSVVFLSKNQSLALHQDQTYKNMDRQDSMLE